MQTTIFIENEDNFRIYEFRKPFTSIIIEINPDEDEIGECDCGIKFDNIQSLRDFSRFLSDYLENT